MMFFSNEQWDHCVKSNWCAQDIDHAYKEMADESEQDQKRTV
jgi:hypothetical protein